LVVDLAAEQLAQVRPDVVVIALTPNPERALGLIEQVSSLTTARILVVGPSADTRLLLRAMRAGTDDYIGENDIDSELPEAFARLKLPTAGASPAARTIAILAPNGGSGSSTLAVNIATALAAKQANALLVDLKFRTGDLASLLDIQPAHTLTDLCENVKRLDRVMLERSLARHSSGVHLLAPGRSLADARLVTPEGVAKVLSVGRTVFPYVVLDLDYSFAPEQVQALRQADVILLVIRLDFICLRNGKRAMEQLEQLNIDRDRVRIVVNRYGQAKEVPAGMAEEALGVKIAHYVPEDAKTVNRANNNGVPVVLDSPSAKVARSLMNLAASVNGLHERVE
jgi:pilus assembly protein CpaE